MAAIVWAIIHGVALTVGGFLVIGTTHYDKGHRRRINKLLGWTGLLFGLFSLGRAFFLMLVRN